MPADPQQISDSATSRTSTPGIVLNTRRGGRGVYFRDSNKHSWELLTRA